MIANRLIALRGDKTQSEVAKALNITRSAMSMYEAGQRVPKDCIKIKLAEYYNKSIESIFYK